VRLMDSDELFESLVSTRDKLVGASLQDTLSHEGESLVLIAPDEIDSLVEKDYRKTYPDLASATDQQVSQRRKRFNPSSANGNVDPNTLVIYALQLPDADQIYAYTQSVRPSDPFVCPFSMYAGNTQRDHRFVWIDLSAGPLRYGPSRGSGVVTHLSLPFFEQEEVFLLQQEQQEQQKQEQQEQQLKQEHQSQQLKQEKIELEKQLSLLKDDYALKLVAFCEKTAQQLLTPSLHHVQPQKQLIPWEHLQITFLSVQEKKTIFSYTEIEKVLSNIPLLDGQTVSFQYERIMLSSIPSMALAYAMALKTTASPSIGTSGDLMHDEHRDQFEDGAASLHTYLDATVLYERVKNFLRWGAPPSDYSHQLYVVVFQLEDAVLLDSLYQSVAFPDLVLAVQQISSKGVHANVQRTGFSCEGITPTYSSLDASRSITASILESGWNLVAPHMFYDNAHDQMMPDYTWSATPSVFGPLSNTLVVPFYVKENAQKNMVYAHLIELQLDVLQVLEPFLQIEQEFYELLDQQRYYYLMQRWHMLEYKLHRTARYIGAKQFNKAMKFLRSARKHEVHEIKLLINEARTHVKSSINCQVADERVFGKEVVAERRRQGNFTSLDWITLVWIILGPFISLVLIAYCCIWTFVDRFKNKSNNKTNHLE